MQLPRARFSIGLKLSLVFTVTLMATFALGAYLIQNSTSKTIETILHEKFDQSLNMAENYFDLLSQTTHFLALNIAEDHSLLRLFFMNDKKAITDYLIDKKTDYQCDQIVLLDKEGDILTQAGQLPFNALNLRAYELIEKTYESKHFQSAILRQGDLFVYYTSAPMLFNDTIEGVVLIGLSINDAMLQNIKKQTNMEFSIIGDRAMAATSFSMSEELIGTLPIAYTEYLWLLKQSHQLYRTKIDGKNYYINAKELSITDPSTNASLMLAYRADKLEADQDALQKLIWLVLLGGVVIAALVSVLIGKKVQNVFKLMIAMTQRIKTGRYGEYLQLNTNDEFTLLANNLNSMGEAIQKQERELSEYAHSLETKVEERTSEINLQRQYLQSILDLQNNMIVTIQNGHIAFTNRLFWEFFKRDHNSFMPLQSLCTLFGIAESACLTPQELQASLHNVLTSKEKPEHLEVSCSDALKKTFEVDYISLEGQENSYIVIFHDITGHTEKQQQLLDQATHDALTGLPNRLMFDNELEKVLYRCRRYDEKASIVVCDIDNFKKINDTYGHLVGDYALVNIARIIEERVRKSDTVSRWGGEEFVLILHPADLSQAEAVAESIREMIAAFEFEHFHHITCSFGITQIMPDDTPDALFKRADEALYKAKDSGKNCIITA